MFFVMGKGPRKTPRVGRSQTLACLAR